MIAIDKNRHHNFHYFYHLYQHTVQQPLVSVILLVYNGEKHLKEAIDSILKQTYNNFELIIVDDGSTDSSQQIIQSYTDKRIILHKNASNMGLVNTLNIALPLCKGKYIARMDADDICLPDRLAKQVAYLNDNSDVIMIDSIMEYIDESGHRLNKYNSTSNSPVAIKYSLPYSNVLGHSSIMMRREPYIRYRYRHTDFEDYDLWLRLINDGYKIHKLPEPLLLYRIHNNSYTISNNRNKKRNYHIRTFNTKWYYWKKISFTDKLKPFNLILFTSMIHNLLKGLYIRYSG
ncbi:hypothetical protein CAP35_05000 [Chitinophagaceae bacterium IBVUCB1]|nr:hypothetical protein CAP35_05000 [Chitinophagaceae bacterium IBVUCB1]